MLSSALPPLVQCLDDALRRIGATEISGFQVTCYGAHHGPRSRFSGHLAAGLSWFDTPEQARAERIWSLLTEDPSAAFPRWSWRATFGAGTPARLPSAELCP